MATIKHRVRQDAKGFYATIERDGICIDEARCSTHDLAMKLRDTAQAKGLEKFEPMAKVAKKAPSIFKKKA